MLEVLAGVDEYQSAEIALSGREQEDLMVDSAQLYIDVGSHPFQMDLVDIGLDKPARLRLQIQIQQRCLVRPAQLVRLP